MGFQKLKLPDCPRCGKSAVRVLESKKAQHGQRRRKECEKCNHRFTTYEIPSETYAKFEHFLYLHQQLSKLICDSVADQTEDKVPEIRCLTCSYNINDNCSFDFPEYDTAESFDCNHYDLKLHPLAVNAPAVSQRP
jgi:hypothetical protein